MAEENNNLMRVAGFNKKEETYYCDILYSYENEHSCDLCSSHGINIPRNELLKGYKDKRYV